MNQNTGLQNKHIRFLQLNNRIVRLFDVVDELELETDEPFFPSTLDAEYQRVLSRNIDAINEYNKLQDIVNNLLIDKDINSDTRRLWHYRPILHTLLVLIAVFLADQIVPFILGRTIHWPFVIFSLFLLIKMGCAPKRILKRSQRQLTEQLGKLMTQLHEYFEEYYPATYNEVTGKSQRKLDTEIIRLKSEIQRLRRQFDSELSQQVSDVKLMFTLDSIFNRFHVFANQLRTRRKNRTPLIIEDEYDVQYLLYALLKIHFDDVRVEEWTPSYAGGSSRMDFLLKKDNTVIEVKKTRDGLSDRKLGEQLIIDIDKYKQHYDCQRLICFIYDPDERIKSPNQIFDLNRSGDLEVKVVIIPNRSGQILASR